MYSTATLIYPLYEKNRPTRPIFLRYLMHEEEELNKQISGNPRNLKRIFNVISITASLISFIQERVACCFCN